MLEIKAQEIKRKLDSGETFHFIDLREEWEYEEDNIGAINIPLPELPYRLEELKPYQNSEIVVHCKTGMRGQQAQLYLRQNGFKNVINLTGGIEAFWGLGMEEA